MKSNITIVVPAHNEQDNLPILCEKLKSTLESLDLNFTVCLVDDGSTDNTWTAIEILTNRYDFVSGIRLSRNFGHQNALLAGLSAANSDAVISMDADLQHPVELIPQIVRAWQNGADIVKTRRLDVQETSLFKKSTSRLYYKLFSYLTGVEIQSGMADFRLISRKVLDELLQLEEGSLFFRGLIEWVGYNHTTIDYYPAQRFSGKSKYNLFKMLKFAWAGISSFSVVPLRLGVLLGLTASVIAFCSTIYAIAGKYFSGMVVNGWSSTLAIVSFLFFCLFLLLGLIGEYLGKVLTEIRHRPRYLVSSYIGNTRNTVLHNRDVEKTFKPVIKKQRKKLTSEKNEIIL